MSFLKIIGKNFAALLGAESKICKSVMLMYIQAWATAAASIPASAIPQGLTLY